MPIERKPKRTVPRNTILTNSVRHKVEDNESWHTLADRYGVAAESIIYANFQTLDPVEVNWYLRHHVGCKKATRDGKNWMFSSNARPGIIQIPPKHIVFSVGSTVTGKLPPRYFAVTVHPSRWIPPPGLADKGVAARRAVSIAPWQHRNVEIGGVTIKGRKQWGASDPIWKNEVIYYNTVYPLIDTFKTIIIHHTNNSDSINSVEQKHKSEGYAAIGYSFFIDQKGDIYEGRPLEIMGSNAGNGTISGPLNDPDWSSVGITLQGDYHHADDWFFSSKAPKLQLSALENLVVALKKKYGINQLLMHREVKRGGKPTVCPGDHMVPHVQSLRKKLGMKGP